MKKLLLTIVIIGVTLNIFTASISDTGFGDTLDEARQAALVNISSTINELKIESVTEVKTVENESISYSSLSEKITAKSTGYLFGVQYTDVATSGSELLLGKWKSTARIDEGVLPLVITRLQELCEILEDLWALYENSTDINESKRYLLSYMDNRLKYDSLKRQARYLGESNVCIPKDVKSYDYALIKYEDLARRDWNNNQSEKYELQKQNDQIRIANLEQKIQQDLLEQTNIDEIKRKNEAAEKELDQQRIQDTIELLLQKDQEDLVQLALSAGGIEEAELGFSEVVSSGLAFKELADSYQRLIVDETERINKDLDDQIDAMRSKEYLFTELGLDGSPTKNAKDVREYEIQKIQEKKQQEINHLINSITIGMSSHINSAFYDYSKKIDLLQSKKYPITSHDSIKITYLGYEGRNAAWILGIEVSIFGKRILKREFLLPYEQIVGKKVPDKNESAAYEEYLDSVDIYNSLIKEFNHTYIAKSSFSVVYNIETAEFLIKLDPEIEIENKEGLKLALFDISNFEPKWTALDELPLRLSDYHFLELVDEFDTSRETKKEITNQRIKKLGGKIFSYLLNNKSISYSLTVGFNSSLSHQNLSDPNSSGEDIDFPSVLQFGLSMYREYDYFGFGISGNIGWDPKKYYDGISLGIAGDILGFFDLRNNARLYLGLYGGLSNDLINQSLGDFGLKSLIMINMGSTLPEEIVKGSGLSLSIQYNPIKNTASIGFGIAGYGIKAN